MARIQVGGLVLVADDAPALELVAFRGGRVGSAVCDSVTFV
jgi:hypothetical protein